VVTLTNCLNVSLTTSAKFVRNAPVRAVLFADGRAGPAEGIGSCQAALGPPARLPRALPWESTFASLPIAPHPDGWHPFTAVRRRWVWPELVSARVGTTWSTPGIDDFELVETLEVLEVSGHDSHVVDQGSRTDEGVAERRWIRHV